MKWGDTYAAIFKYVICDLLLLIKKLHLRWNIINRVWLNGLSIQYVGSMFSIGSFRETRLLLNTQLTDFFHFISCWFILSFILSLSD